MKKQITKSYLEYLGVTEVTRDGRVFTKRGIITPGTNGNGYQIMGFGGCKEGKRPHNIYIHQIVYAWFNDEVPYGKTIHHKDLNRANNSLDNLVAMTPEEHRQLHYQLRNCKLEEKCRLDIPREHYLKKIAEYEAKGAYTNAAQYKRRLKYYDSHIKEVNELTEFQKDKAELAYWKKVFHDEGNKRQWHEVCKVEKVAKASSIDDAQRIIKHALEVIHRHFGRD